MTVNIPLLRKCVEWAEVEHARGPLSQWNQACWAEPFESVVWARVYDEARQEYPEATYEELSDITDKTVKAWEVPTCGTAYCVAGYAAMVSGLTDEHGIELNTDAVRDVLGEDAADIDLHSWEDVGRTLLGLTKFQAGWLFNGDNTIERVRDIAEEIAGERL